MRKLAAVLLTLIILGPAQALITQYSNQALFEADLAALGITPIHEGFEEDAAWGHVRSPYTAYTVYNQGITWTANNVNSGVTTGPGPVRTGVYGFFELPHGDWNAGISDGWIMTGDELMYGAGGWLETNTYGARVNLILDGSTVVDFEDRPLDYAHQFYGVIDTDGFLSVEITETEALPGDEWYYVFSDDFYFGMPSSTSVPEESAGHLASILHPNSPNPFNPSTRIRFELRRSSRATLSIFDSRGRKVKTLLDSVRMNAGTHEFVWDGRDERESSLPSGLYLYRLLTADEVLTRRMTLLK